jgi:hypothetical protein
MEVSVDHRLKKAEAIRRIDTGIQELLASPEASKFKVSILKKVWTGETLEFVAKASKSLISVRLAGKVHVKNHSVKVSCDLPSLLKTFVGEDAVKDTVIAKLRQVLGE